MALTATDSAVVAQLNGAGLGLTTDTNLFRGPIRPADDDYFIPVEAVFVLASGGDSPVNYLDDGAVTPQMYMRDVEILIRSDRDNFVLGQQLAIDVYEAMHDVPPSGYVSCRATTSFPRLLGKDALGSWIWQVNLEMRIEE